MGVSTNAYLFYGYLLPEDYDPWELVDEFYLADDSAVAIGQHCSDECTMYYVYTSQTMAYRGSPKRIDNLDNLPLWDVQLQEFIKEHNLPSPGEKTNEYEEPASEFGWWLASYWG
jgi:hypothetical protein